MKNLKKQLFFISILLFASFGLSAQNSGALFKVGPYITFLDSEHDFKDIKQGAVVEKTFSFYNSGTHPLILSDVLVTCGCTATEWPKKPIIPGDTATVTVKFDSAGKVGRQNKVVTVVSNAVNNQEQIKIVANILPPKQVN